MSLRMRGNDDDDKSNGTLITKWNEMSIKHCRKGSYKLSESILSAYEQITTTKLTDFMLHSLISHPPSSLTDSLVMGLVPLSY